MLWSFTQNRGLPSYCKGPLWLQAFILASQDVHLTVNISCLKTKMSRLTSRISSDLIACLVGMKGLLRSDVLDQGEVWQGTGGALMEN